MANLEARFAGLTLINPIVVSSAGITETAERMRKCQDDGAAAVVMKSYFEKEVSRQSPTPRFKVIRHDLRKRHKTFTLFSYEQASEWDIERYAQEVVKAKAELTIKIIPSINCITDEGWVESARLLERAGADAIELNTSCPHGSITFAGGAVEETICRTVRLVREAVSVPVVAKISPMLTSPLTLVKALEETGIQGVTIFNRMTALEIDIDSEEPIMHGGYAGHGGPWAILYPLRWISEVRPQVKLDVAGSGGVANWEDVVKYILAGATVVQTCTAVVMNGYGIVRDLVNGLEQYMDAKGYETLDDFRGRVTERIISTEEVDRRHRFRAEIQHRLPAPCTNACPAGVPAQAYVSLTAEGKFAEALDQIRSKNPFQSVCAHVCYHPCETECTRGELGDPVAIRAVKRFLIEWGEKHYPLEKMPVKKARSTGKLVAVIGAGVAGLSAAHDLALNGHEVTVFEKLPVAGGMMVVGIPAYRLPREVFEREIVHIKRLGVEIRLNCALGCDVTLNDLRADGYDAVLLTVGAHGSIPLGIPGEDSEGVVSAIDFLREVNLGERKKVPNRVAVIGGGNSALDVARCALRLGAEEVYLVYRRSKDEMPVHEFERLEAEEEGVRVLYLGRPLEIVTEEGGITGVRFAASYLAEPGSDGRRIPESVPGAEYVIPADLVIAAVGQAPATNCLSEPGPETDSRGVIQADERTGRTSVEWIFAAGDAAGRPNSVIEAIAHGKRAAVAIDRYLRGQGPEEPQLPEPVPDKMPILARSLEEPSAERIARPRLPPEQRLRTFDEVELVFTEEEAIREAARCLTCGCGLGCGICKNVCIYEAVHEVGNQFQIDPEKCDGCGLCIELCPHGNIALVPVDEQ